MRNRKSNVPHQKTESNNNTREDSSHQKLFLKFRNLRNDAEKRGLGTEDIQNVFRSVVYSQEVKVHYHISVKKIVAITVVVTLAVLGGLGLLVKYFGWDENVTAIITESRCLLENGGFVIEVARPLTKCEGCRNLRDFPVEKDLSPEEFVQKYAYSAVPVLIKGATRNWTAMGNFSYHFFKNLYTETKDALETIEDECQFFPYKTEFHTLADVFNMSDDRANFVAGEKPWYIGWSNCHSEVAKVLRQHYNRPYFLPTDSESSAVDWIFMGGPGLGAFVHLDYVQKPSWQAQISGKKTWTLIPTPECEHVCHSLNITVSTGDIIVLDTNQWYHATYIHPGQISITIGSEYD